MPPHKTIFPNQEREKREELKTYRELSLKRELKSAAQRRRVEAGGIRRVLGDGSATQPYLVVESRRYREVRLEVQRQLLLEAKKIGLDLPPDLLLRQLKPRVEAMTYTQLAGEKSHEAFQHVTLAALGRRLTPQERKQFAAAAGEKASRPANQVAQTALNHALGSIEERLAHNPARYQTIWVQIVGPDAAHQSQLEHVDAATQTAYFRCYNSVLSSDLQRRPGLAAKLAKALGIPVQKLRAKF